MKVQKWIKSLFVAAGLYDSILGILFLMAPIGLFKAASVTLPNHIGYVQFPAMLLIVFAIVLLIVGVLQVALPVQFVH